MNIAVLSGKGGTGKTTIAVNLAVNSKNAVLIDTDVEEPNSHIFLKPHIERTYEIKKKYPVIDTVKCTLCGECGDFCNYNAILPAKNKVLVLKELCHDCGGCELVCSFDAISFDKRDIGKIYSGKSQNDIPIIYGDLNVGEVSAVKIIERLREIVANEELVIIDSPPGTSCSTVSAVEEVDYAIIVSEPTPFGVSDMKMVVEMLRHMKISFGVVVNKSGLGDNEIYEYCKDEGIVILEEIIFDTEIAKSYAKGDILSYKIEGYSEKMSSIMNKVLESENNE
ncbi:ATP-binding protein [Mycoplasmatota bacterium]|nr:ATP-binding protein [Mycoplasmatota bacterium]